MKKGAIIGISILAMIWLVLAWLMLSTQGITLRTLLLLAMSGVIVFVPLFKKYGKNRKED